VRVPSRVISLRSAVCLLGRFPALAGADLDVDAGEVVLCTGPNGAGKTTLLRVCAGLLPLRSGTAVVLDHDLARDRRELRRAVGLVGHETFAYDDLTVRENVRFATRAAGRSKDAADDAIARVGLAELVEVPHGRLSQGQRRRLSLAIALARDPQLLLLDEPHAGLDDEGRAIVDAVLAAAPHEGRTVLLASHEVDLARRFATREVAVIAGQVHAVPGANDPSAVGAPSIVEVDVEVEVEVVP
jgi:heme ABC exporter ATP-binding subunit CcmA